jgi:hypothetical protein
VSTRLESGRDFLEPRSVAREVLEDGDPPDALGG